MEKINFVEYLIYNNIDVNKLSKLVTVTTKVDEDNDMIQIYVEDVCVAGGNYSDIYDGCETHPYIGDYNNDDELLDCLKHGFLSINLNVTFKKGVFSYDD